MATRPQRQRNVPTRFREQDDAMVVDPPEPAAPRRRRQAEAPQVQQQDRQPPQAPQALDSEANITTVEPKRGRGRPALSTLHRSEADRILNGIIFGQKMYLGRDRIFELVKSRFPNNYRQLGLSRRYISTFMSRSEVYATHKPTKDAKVLQRQIQRRPFAKAHCDLKDMQARAYGGYRYIFGLVDAFSKQIWLRAIKSKTDKDVSDALRSVFESAPRPFSVVVHDQGPEFNNAKWKAVCDEYGVKSINSMPYKPQSNGLIERQWGSVSRQISMHEQATGSKDWPAYLPTLEANLNATVQGSTKKTANDIVAAYLARDSAATDATQAQLRKVAYGRSNDPVSFIDRQLFNVGDRVRLRLNWLKASAGPTFSRQYFVVTKRGRSAYGAGFFKTWYMLKDSNGEALPNRYYNDQLTPYVPSEIKSTLEETFIVNRFEGPSLYTNNAVSEPGVIVAWLGYQQRTVEPVRVIEVDVPALYAKWVGLHNVRWTQTRGQWKYSWDGRV